MVKIGRNSKCPCGSGKKYKKCCLGKKDDVNFSNPLNFKDSYKEVKKASIIKQCLHPNKKECSERIIKAHSIQNNKILKKISDNGQVYMPYPKNDNPFATQTMYGRKEATIFWGFCGYHDTVLFSPIENKNFNYSDEHVFLYTYRCWALVYHRKLEVQKLSNELFKRKPTSMLDTDMQDMSMMNDVIVDDYLYYKKIFDKSIIDIDYDVLENIVWTYDYEVKFACSGVMAVEYDLKNNVVQDLANTKENVKHIFYNIFPENGNTYCIISWLKEDSDIFNEYINQLNSLSDDERIIYLNNVIPIAFENIAINPIAWDNLSHAKKDEFNQLMWGMSTIFTAMTGRKYNMLEPTSFNLFDL